MTLYSWLSKWYLLKKKKKRFKDLQYLIFPFESDSQQAESKEIKTGPKSLSNEESSAYK